MGFGKRDALVQPNLGGAAYRTLRNIVVPLPFTLNCSDWRRALQRRRGRVPSFRVSFTGSVNGPSRSLVRAAAEQLFAVRPSQRDALAVRFVFDDEERRRLSVEPSAILRDWFGPSGPSSFDELLRESHFCLVLPGDVSDLALRFFHAVSVGCTPVIVGGPSQTIALPFAEFVQYSKFARLTTVHNVNEAVTLLTDLLDEMPAQGRLPLPHLEEVAGLFTHHIGCGVPSGGPFRELLGRALKARTQVWAHIRWSV